MKGPHVHFGTDGSLTIDGVLPRPARKVETMMVVTCRDCRAWYSMDFEEGIDDEHYNMRTGRLCPNNDNSNWDIREVPYREDWRYVS